MARILVTGGAGFIGSNVADRFIQDGHKVVIIDNLSTGLEANLPQEAKFYKLDIRSAVIDKIFEREKPDFLCHHAAQIDVRKSAHNPIFDAEVNIIGSLNLFDSCVKHKVKKIIFASTGGAIYGEQSYFPADENHPAYPLSPYGVAKLTMEKYLHFYKETYGIEFVSLRYANVYGPRQNPLGEAGVVAIFTERLLGNKKAVINGDGKQTRDFVFVEDAVESNVLALKYPKSDIFNIGTGIETDINCIFRILKEKTASKQKEIHGATKSGEQARSVLECSKAKRLLKWKPKYDLEEGIAKTVKYYKVGARKRSASTC
ncbi:UDP-glucose 4-epimerase [candidate division WOR-1 bacterium DG_54_3]|uniref:UDP-glucose 4-epimerase n=1 Tax=candidate division WOR-1 bacterium DG_54_3 TaxID=1703775 RepID=A0A0S7XUJ1_UNCSA|nr:MAG: UDP-glucose 4-epimerase [candidate division WOR-1 bacterium DG_54_3]